MPKSQTLKICLASSELAPLAKTGGLADVSAALGAELHRSGHELKVVLPRYSSIDETGLDVRLVDELGGLSIRAGGQVIDYSIVRANLPGSGLPLYLVDCPRFFQRGALYTNDGDEFLRFVLLSRAALELCQRLKFAPDIFHCNDWQTSLIPLYLKTTYAWDQLFANTRSVLTIHNIGYQGMFPGPVLPELGLDGAEHHLHQDDLKDGVINFLKTGILYADAITTVSPTYAREIMGDDYGMGLNHLLRERMSSVFGILNGVDYGEWNPETDTLIPANYSAEDLSGKRECKRVLMQELGLDPIVERPLVGLVSRLAGQKGIDLIEEVMPRFLGQRDMAFAVLGSGESTYEAFFERLQSVYRDRVCYYRGFSNKLAHMIEAGSDMFLMPSLYEPCGLNQMYSLKYGTVPVVRETGGLADSVRQVNPATGTGDGVLFRDYNADGLAWALHHSLELFANGPLWKRIMLNGMAKDFSWKQQVGLYVELFERLTGRQP